MADIDIRATLRGAGLRATKARCLVLSLLLEQDGPLSHADVVQLEAITAAGLDRAVVYRNLMDLTEVGLLSRTNMDGVWRFEPVTGDAHPHFVCHDCGIVKCLPDGAISIRATQGTPRSLDGGSLSISVRGLCDLCV